MNGAADLPRLLGPESRKNVGDTVGVSRGQQLLAWLEERLDSGPGVSEDAGCGTGRFEHACRRREAVTRHAFPVEVEGRQCRAEKDVVLPSSDVAGQPDVRWYLLGLPTRASQQELASGEAPRRLEEEFLDTRFPVRQAIAEKTEVAGESVVARGRIMRLGVERIVDRHACTRAQLVIGAHDGGTAAV